MANIRIDLNHAPLDGETVSFKAPCNASDITGLVVYYQDASSQEVSKEFTLNDANGNDLGSIDNIFAEGAIVKVILDTDLSNAFVQNPDTNAYLESRFRNKNLLDNWYFANPVDQRGGYIVPPGTRYYKYTGLTTQMGTLTAYAAATYVDGTYGSIAVNGATYYVDWSAAVRGYAGAGYTIDRWKIWENWCVTVSSGGVRVKNDVADNGFFQYLEDPNMFNGCTITGSVLMADGNLYTGSLNVGEPSDELVYAVFCETPFGDLRHYYGNDLGTDVNAFGIWVKSGNDITIKAAKLELGTQQTLAHQENGKWVLNEIPDYGEELRKCQRYQLVIGRDDTFVPIGLGQARQSTLVTIQVPTPVTLRDRPTATFVAQVSLRNKEVYATVDYDSSHVDIYGPGSVWLTIFCTSATVGAAYDMYCEPGGKLILDANL